MAHTKRAWKLQEFVAHGSKVNCLAIGQKSGRVLVTGGEDRKVNLWEIGRPNCVMSLTGHTTPVEAVRFGQNENMVVAGSVSGALKIWNLEEAKILRTLTGHKSSVKSLDFHPYGDYVASGSMDCNVKLWDIRRKGCIYTYKGHTNCVNCLRFSPDGRWISSAGEDGVVRIWDLTAGKQIAELKHPGGSAVYVNEFHPNELLLASGCADRIIRFWDLETFEISCATDMEATPTRCLYFHPDGMCIFGGSSNLMKVYGWEPVVCQDSVPIGWGEVAEIASGQNQIIGASFSQTNVSTYVIDMKRVQPFGGVPHQEGGGHLSSSRKNFITERPPTQSSRQNSKPKEEDEEQPSSISPDNEDKDSSADINDPEEYKRIFQRKSRLERSPPRNVEPFQPPPDDEPEPVRQPAPAKQPEPVRAEPPKPIPERTKPTNISKESKDKISQRNAQPTIPVPPVPQISTSRQLPSPSVQQPPIQQPKGVIAEDFLPKNSSAGGDYRMPSEDDILNAMMKGHTPVTTVMTSRSRNLEIVRAMWTAGSTKTAIDSALSMNDPAVIIDVLNVLNARAGLWNLDLSASLIPHLKDLLCSKYESYVMTSGESLKIVLKNFGPVIKANLLAPPSIGVDISREERHRKCNLCYNKLMEIRSVIDKRQNVMGKVGDLFKQLQILIRTLD
ncbi:hypothetical protein CHS0354_003552 [Potamilus streckersoni]|uniref:Katanin p80 WD40 repeat-containing subunit B1 n=1 Tax=Potamilus streckersoni TaxID=2493646 RepID=A0AAE0RV96_9BIVA|nr:hypothetical protein CHS0354_003552 [Potamilus streckersoni]